MSIEAESRDPLYRKLAILVDAYWRCVDQKNNEWLKRHRDQISRLVRTHMPHGSGFDGECEFVLSESNGNKLVMLLDFHHMDEDSYVGWSRHRIVVEPHLAFEYVLDITGHVLSGMHGEITNQIEDTKDFIHETVATALHTLVEEDEREPPKA